MDFFNAFPTFRRLCCCCYRFLVYSIRQTYSEWFPLFDKFFDLIHHQYWQMFHVRVRKTWNVQFDLTNLSFPGSLPMSLHRLWLHTLSASGYSTPDTCFQRRIWTNTTRLLSTIFCAIVAMYLFAHKKKKMQVWLIYNIAARMF